MKKKEEFIPFRGQVIADENKAQIDHFLEMVRDQPGGKDIPKRLVTWIWVNGFFHGEKKNEKDKLEIEAQFIDYIMAGLPGVAQRFLKKRINISSAKK